MSPKLVLHNIMIVIYLQRSPSCLCGLRLGSAVATSQQAIPQIYSSKNTPKTQQTPPKTKHPKPKTQNENLKRHCETRIRNDGETLRRRSGLKVTKGQDGNNNNNNNNTNLYNAIQVIFHSALQSLC